MSGIAPAIANAWLDGLCRSVTWTEPAAFYLKLHTADPGSAGTSAPAVETTRKAVTFSAASAGSITNSVAITWSSLPAAETFTHVSFWDTVGPAGGTFLGSQQLGIPVGVTIGSSYTIQIGEIILSLSPVA